MGKKKTNQTHWLCLSDVIKTPDRTDENNRVNFKAVQSDNYLNGEWKITYEEESIIKILYKNDSNLKQVLLDYQTMNEHYSQLRIVNKIQLPLTIGKLSQTIFEITVKGRYLGKSEENIEFIFKTGKQKAPVFIDVTDKRLDFLRDVEFGSTAEVDILRLHELLLNPGVPGIRQKPNVTLKKKRPPEIKTWKIPSAMRDCCEIVKENYKSVFKPNCLKQHYPVVFEHLTYQNYRNKFHALLYMNEIEIVISLQTYAQKSVKFTKCDDYLVLKIPNLSERRPQLIHNDGVIVTRPTGFKHERYQGFIHKVLANEIRLMFNETFQCICGQRVYDVDFFNNRSSFIKSHNIVEKNKLSETFLFPKLPLEYQPPKLVILSPSEMGCEMGRKIKRKGAQLPIVRIEWFDKKLNDEQKSAVVNILKGEGRPLPYVIYGPPGTGKTITLIESIIQVYKELPQKKLLICAPTNVAVHMLLGKLIGTGLFKNTVMKRIVSANHYKDPLYNNEYDEYCIVTNHLESFLEKKDSKSIKDMNIVKLKIIVTTVCLAHNLYEMGLNRGEFSHIFIDEAGQTMEPDILFPLSFLGKNDQVILAGDPKQLGPVVISMIAKKNGLGQSMLARFVHLSKVYERDCHRFPDYNGFNPKLITHLIYNYRSLPEIVDVFSSLFYDRLLKATKTGDEDEERVFLNKLNINAHWDIGCNGPVIVHGVRGKDFQEKRSPSWFNPHEALHVFLYFEKLLRAGLSADDIGIITPYVTQVAKINLLLKKVYSGKKLPKVSSVELFQGQERKVIIISLVRGHSEKGRQRDKTSRIDFLASEERINVAMSRAKSLVIVIGNPSTMRSNQKWGKILEEAKERMNYVGCNDDF